jgi:UDP-2-acetamido-2,6-beta-L-arabino-hexul-4-ose reductase
MLKIGITGQNGFIGTHLYNTLGLCPDLYQRIPFDRSFFSDPSKLQQFVSQCDAIVHLAGLNRHNDPQVIYETNLDLVKRLITAMEATGSKPHVLFASSTQEEKDNPYGRSKKEGRALLVQWAERNNARFTGMVIPNVFGPFGHPFYNSVVATFCHQLTHGETPEIHIDGELQLIYVGELVEVILKQLATSNEPPAAGQLLTVQATATIKVSGLLEKLYGFKEQYLDQRIIPDLGEPFDRNLFNTFVCYIDHQSFFPGMLKPHADQRGSFVEVLKLNRTGGQVSFSTTASGITRGDHFHTRKFERFAVIKGNARIEIRRIGTDKKISFDLDGEKPSFVDMPIWHTHNITNIGDDEVYTLFWISEFYDPNDPDTFYEKV